MRIALTGSSSTGKTTLGKRLMENRRFADAVGEFVNEDARSLLRSLGHGNMDRMSRAELRQFQNLYFLQKSQNEATRERFLVDRSYVDVAAYWLVRDSFDLPPEERDPMVFQCRELARQYDLHVYLPMDQIPFAPDGYRSEDTAFHRRIASAIASLLQEWKIAHTVIQSAHIQTRVQQVLAFLPEA